MCSVGRVFSDMLTFGAAEAVYATQRDGSGSVKVDEKTPVAPATPKSADSTILDADASAKRKAIAAGMSGTNATSPLGVAAPATLAKKTLLG